MMYADHDTLEISVCRCKSPKFALQVANAIRQKKKIPVFPVTLKTRVAADVGPELPNEKKGLQHQFDV